MCCMNFGVYFLEHREYDVRSAKAEWGRRYEEELAKRALG